MFSLKTLTAGSEGTNLAISDIWLLYSAMAIIDSKAAFKSRAAAFGIPEREVDILEAESVATFAAFAFVAPYNANAPDDEALKKALVGFFVADPTVGSLVRYRRLQFESHTQLLSDTQLRLERTDESVARRMPAPERAARHRDQIRRLVSVQITQDNEPSHGLLDLAQQMVEDQMIRHINLEKCTSRVLELRGLRGVEGQSDLGSDYKIRQAFLRRSLAFDQATLIGFDTHERWVNSLFAAMARSPPFDYNFVTLEQVLSADRELFYYLGEECRDGVGLNPRGQKIVEEAMKLLMVDIRITCFMTPLQRSSSAAGKRALPGTDNPISKNAAKKARKALAAAHSPAVHAPAAKAKGKGKGKGKDRISMPAGLEGCWHSVDGDNVCPDFQFNRCSEATPGSRCSKGVHKCCVPRCKGLHSHQDCPNKSNIRR